MGATAHKRHSVVRHDNEGKKMGSQKKFREDITFLRAISVLMVVIFHFTFPLSKGGFIGVDVFFVISGFLMTQIIETGLQESKFKYSQFLVSRIKRIWPAMGVMLLTLLAVGAMFMPPLDTSVIASQVLYAVGFVSNHYYLSTSGYFSGDNDSRWLLHTWSLSVEWQFYLIYPFILMASRSLSMRISSAQNFMKVHVAILAVLLLASLALCVYVSNHDASTAFFLLPTRAWEMLAGGMAFFAYRYISLTELQRMFFSYMGLAMIAGSFVFIGRFDLERLWPSYYAIFPVAGAVLVLWAAFTANRFIKNRILQSIGLWSYSIYLWHWPLVVFFGITLFQEKFSLESKVIGFTLSVALGYLSYRFVENANAQSIKTLLLAIKKPAIIMISAAISASVLIGLKGLDYKTSGDPFYASLMAKPQAAQMPSECNNFKTPADKLKTCRVEKGSARNALVIGDSHARHLYPWFAVKSPLSTDFLIAVGCPSLPGYNRIGAGYYCDSFSEKAWSKALSGDYAVVFVSMNWSAFKSGMCRSQKGSCMPSTSAALNEPVAKLESLLGEAKAKGIKIVLVGPTPFFPHSVPEYLYRHAFWTKNSGTLLSARDFDELNEDFIKLFESVRDKYSSDINYEPIAKSICVENVCSVYDAELKIPIFMDTDHFNPDWVVKRGDIFSKYLQ